MSIKKSQTKIKKKMKNIICILLLLILLLGGGATPAQAEEESFLLHTMQVGRVPVPRRSKFPKKECEPTPKDTITVSTPPQTTTNGEKFPQPKTISLIILGIVTICAAIIFLKEDRK